VSYQWCNCVSSTRRYQGLEPDAGKLSSPVLRGLGGSNPARLPGIPAYSCVRNPSFPSKNEGSASQTTARIRGCLILISCKEVGPTTG
jgi:hypothetical protein